MENFSSLFQRNKKIANILVKKKHNGGDKKQFTGRGGMVNH